MVSKNAAFGITPTVTALVLLSSLSAPLGAQDSAALIAEASDFLAQMAAEDGAVRTASGLVITEITGGTGDSPTASDIVTVHYHGTLQDGTVFDSSVQRGTPASFPLNRVIPCWTEGVQLMKVGGKNRLVCPSAVPSIRY